MEGKFNIDSLKGIFSSQPIGIPDRKMGNACRGEGGDTEMPEAPAASTPSPPQQINPCS